MNWEKLERIILDMFPDAKEGVGQAIKELYHEQQEVYDIPLTEAKQKIVRDAFVSASRQHKDAKDNARHFVSWALAKGWDFKVNERYKSVGNISIIVDMYWTECGETREVQAEHDLRIQYIFMRMKWWTIFQKLHFLRNYSPEKLTYYAWVVWNARQDEVDRQEYYLSAKGLLEGDQRLESIFRDFYKFFFIEDNNFWFWKVKKEYMGYPKRRPEYVIDTPEYIARREREKEEMLKLHEYHEARRNRT